MRCQRCGKPRGESTAVVRGDEGYPIEMLRAGDPLCADCNRDRAKAEARRWNIYERMMTDDPAHFEPEPF